jgi:hypothetical protein
MKHSSSNTWRVVGRGGGGYRGQTRWTRSFLSVYPFTKQIYVRISDKKLSRAFTATLTLLSPNSFEKIILSLMFTPYCGSIYCNSQHSPCLSTGKKAHTSYWDCIQRKTWLKGPYAGVDFNSSYLIVNSVVSYPPHYKVKGVEWGRSLLLVEHICICLQISKTTNRKRESREKGEARGESWSYVFE